MSNLFIFLLVLLAVLQVLDVVSTSKALKNPDLAEGNPIVSKVIKKLGVIGGLVFIKLAVFIPIAWYLNWHISETNSNMVALVFLDIVYVYIIVNNFKLARG